MFKSESQVEEFFFHDQSVKDVYGSLRHLYPHSVLLEASDYQPDENCFSFICINPVASIQLKADFLICEYPDGTVKQKTIKANCNEVEKFQALKELESFYQSFEAKTPPEYQELTNGIFGYLSYDAVDLFESISLKPEVADSIPKFYYQAFEFIIVVNNYRNIAYVIKNNFHSATASGLSISDIRQMIKKAPKTPKSFSASDDTTSNLTTDEHKQVILKAKEHIKRGDVFQIVPSRSFTQEYEGDDFLLYLALRAVNPSPYLFYFDYGAFRLFGSSPEADLLINNGRAVIHPIAGTCPNVADQNERNRLIKQLKADPKENAEHVMLVDLARNDLNKHCRDVRVDNYREVQAFSHVIHLVSVVSGELLGQASPIQLLADTFPAGTLTGAPKFRAMELIDMLEPDRREFYGGAIGFIDFNGDCVHAIMIRSFLSRNGQLIRRAGGGVVDQSVVEMEVAEVENKLMALKRAIEIAGEV